MMSTPATTEYAVDLVALDTLFFDARSANTFSDEPVDAATLQAIYDLAKVGPTSMNTSPLRVAFIVAEQAKARLLPHVFEGNVAKVSQAPVTAILAVDTDFHEQMPTLFPHAPDAKDRFSDAQARAGFAEFNATLQMGYFIVAVRALGLAAGPVGGADFAGIDAEFFGDVPWHAKMLVNIGMPGDNPWFDRLPRLDAEVATITL